MKKIDYKRIGLKLVGVSAGAVAGDIAYHKIAPNMNGNIKAAALALVGAALPEFNRKSKMLDDAGSGVIAAAAINEGRQLFPNLISGVGKPNENGIGAEDSVEFDLNPDEEVAGVGSYDNGIGVIDDDSNEY